MAKKSKKKLQKGRQKLKKGLHVFKDWLQKQNPKDLAEVAIMVGLAYAGYETFKDWRGALLGPVSLKLAQTSGGTLSPSQIAGIAGLSLLGVAIAGGERFEQTYKVLTGEPVFRGVLPQEGPNGEPICPPGYKLVISRLAGGAACIPSGEPT